MATVCRISSKRLRNALLASAMATVLLAAALCLLPAVSAYADDGSYVVLTVAAADAADNGTADITGGVDGAASGAATNTATPAPTLAQGVETAVANAGQAVSSLPLGLVATVVVAAVLLVVAVVARSRRCYRAAARQDNTILFPRNGR